MAMHAGRSDETDDDDPAGTLVCRSGVTDVGLVADEEQLSIGGVFGTA